ncbi:MAG: N-alpha-acetyl diaminobutyric acid deacetylase DoeB [Alphaproteobacteria bacterium]|jgi:N-alpha-acetyl-L-2,4-diaminobutyrate deacetylase|nr:N-alpha-acetyl diaminobutyric acid deacetylase DoeB [Alphaproteobacteria bacterium]
MAEHDSLERDVLQRADPHRPVTRVSTRIDFDAEGKRFGHLVVPHSRNDSAWGSVQIPVCVIARGSGPTVLMAAAAHGDEYEGPIALMKLARAIEAHEVQGRLVIVPSTNMPAVRSGTRLSPIDGLNLNRVYPGRFDGTVTEVIAHYVATHLLPMADIVVDLHSGGKTLNFLPSAVMHYLDDRPRMERTLAAVKAFGAPAGLVLRELDSQGMLDTAAEEMGRIFVTTELGGSGTLTRETVEIAETGVRNLLAHFGLLDEPVVPPEARGRAPTRMMHTPDETSFVLAEDSGIFEVLVDLGEPVAAGQPIGQIHFFEQPDRSPLTYFARTDGVLWCRHAPGLVQRGDCIAVIADDFPG